MEANPFPSTQIVDSSASPYGLDLRPAGCGVCGQAFLVEPARLGGLCPNCFKGPLSDQPARLRPEPPEKVVPFRLNHAALTPILTAFTQGVWLHADDFTPQSLLQHVIPVYWPMWLVDANLCGDWQAEAGFDYQVKSSQESYAGGGWRSTEVLENRIRWEPRAGQINRRYDNVPAPALRDHARLESALGKYDVRQAMPFDPALLAYTAVRIPDLPTESAWPLAKTALDSAASDQCRQASSAPHMRNFSVRACYERQNWTQLLQPLYLTWYTADDGTRQIVAINGQTGQISGPRLASQRKGWAMAGTAALIGIILFILGLIGLALLPLLPVGVLLMVLAFGAFIYAVIPALWPWQWNRSQQNIKITTTGNQ